MTPQEFIDKYLGKTVGYPTNDNYKGECLSLAKWYIKECFEINPPASGTNSAYGYWSNFPDPLGTKFKKVEYKQGMTIPVPAWCIPIWNTKVGDGCGHIAVRTKDKSDTNNFISLDQNWNTKSAQLTFHTYTNLQGWLEPLDYSGLGTQENGSDIIDGMEKLPKDSVLKDILNGLCGSTTDDEVNAYLDSKKNIYEVVVDVCRGNKRFYNMWIEPNIPEIPPTTSETPKPPQDAPGEVSDDEKPPISDEQVEEIKKSVLTQLIEWIKKLLKSWNDGKS